MKRIGGTPTHRHLRLVPAVTCHECGRSMYQLNTKGGQIIYGCTGGHLRKIGQPTQSTPPPAA